MNKVHYADLNEMAVLALVKKYGDCIPHSVLRNATGCNEMIDYLLGQNIITRKTGVTASRCNIDAGGFTLNFKDNEAVYGFGTGGIALWKYDSIENSKGAVIH